MKARYAGRLRFQARQTPIDALRAQGFGLENVSPEAIGGFECSTYTRVFSDGNFSVLLEQRGNVWIAHGDFYWEARHNIGQLRAFTEYTPEDLVCISCDDISLLVDFRRGETWESLSAHEIRERADRFPEEHSKLVIEEALKYGQDD